MLKEIITKWLGEEKWKATQTNYENHNQSLENLKSRIPELEEMILGEIENEIKQINKCFTEIRTIENRKMKEAMNENKVSNASVINWCVTGERILHDLYFKNHTPQGGKE